MEATQETRSEAVQARVTPTERAEIERAAENDSRTVSDWCRLAILRALRGEAA